jgi:hypothetical protein
VLRAADSTVEDSGLPENRRRHWSLSDLMIRTDVNVHSAREKKRQTARLSLSFSITRQCEPELTACTWLARRAYRTAMRLDDAARNG